MIEIEVIKPDKFIDVDKLESELQAVLESAIDESEGYYDDVSATWDHDPDLERESGMTSRDLYNQVGSDDTIMRDLDDGTHVRYNVMTEDFEPKTFVRELRSSPGRGGFAYRDTSPRPGIDAREWTDEIAKIVEPKLAIKAQAAIDKVFK